MKRTLRGMLLAFCITVLPGITKVFGQYYYYNNNYYDNDLVFEFGGGLGGMNCLTDIGGSKSKNGFYINEIGLKNTRLNGEIYAGVMYQQMVGVRIQATYGNVTAYDSILKGAKGASRGRYERNLSFRSPIREIAVLAEFHPLMLRYFKDGPPRFSPYVTAGIAWFTFNPQANLKGAWVDLRPLRTEGQGFAEYKDREVYHLSQTSIPIGYGVKYDLSPLFNVRAEFLHRITFTDYLDDVSKTYIDPALFDQYLSPFKAAQARALYDRSAAGQNSGPRGGPKSKDSYMTFNLKIGLIIGREKKR